jgi:hypothetical protein
MIHEDYNEHEGRMAKRDAAECAADSHDVANMIQDTDDLPEWLEAKITLAAEYMNTVKDWLTHHASGDETSTMKIQLKSLVPERIVKVDDKWVVYPKGKGKRLGTHDTKEAALKQLAAIEINKGKR